MKAINIEYEKDGNASVLVIGEVARFENLGDSLKISINANADHIDKLIIDCLSIHEKLSNHAKTIEGLSNE